MQLLLSHVATSVSRSLPAHISHLIIFFIVISSESIRSQQRDEAPKRVLVTGAAGFIGYHVARTLTRNPQHLVVAIDNFNEFYDVQLKIDRAYDLHKHGAFVLKRDICNKTFLETAILEHRFTHVVHLAAQAGVRYSLKNPQVYVTANIECYMVILETLKQFPTTKLIYASSSSVYSDRPERLVSPLDAHDLSADTDSPQLFRLSSDVDHPSNMYAATKRTSELLSDLYCHTAGLSALGLRFFTVYGPWGRPDMAVYKFTRSIADGADLPLYYDLNGTPLSRDFTYIDDVIAGVLAAMDYSPSSCGERFNIGYGSPVKLPELIQYIERELNLTAKIKRSPLPPTEKLRTWADISETRKYLNFRPVVHLEEGVKRFIRWFKIYHSAFNTTNTVATRNWFSTL